MPKLTGQFGLDILPGLVIPPNELQVRATRASGPGGQHVNTSSTRVELLWNLSRSQVVDDAQRARLRLRLAPRLDSAGNVRVVASDTRSQRQNRSLAERRLAALVRRALAVPKKRKRTAPTRSAVERRLQAKKLHSLRKRERKLDDGD